eukprot:g2551.t1
MGNANCVLLGNGKVSLTRLCSLAKIARSVNSRTSLDRLSASHARMVMSPGYPERPSRFQKGNACAECPEGFFQENPGADSCAPCEVGKFAVLRGAKACAQCHTHSGTIGRGAASAAACLCNEGFRLHEGVCEPCFENALCVNGTIKTKPGFQLRGGDNRRVPCDDPSVCLLDDKCLTPNRGPLCAACAEGSYMRTGSGICIACYELQGLSILFMIGVLIVVVMIISIVTIMTIKGGGKASATDIVIGKIALNHFIIASAARYFPLKWPPFVLDFFTAMTVMSASAMGDSGLSMSCIVREHTAMKPVQSWALAITLAMPILIVAQLVFWRLQKDTTGAHISIMISLLLAHPTLTKAAISLIACRTVVQESFLFADMNISCSSPEYISWLGLALPMLLVFSIGIPLYYFLILRRHVEKGTLDAHRAIYGYLTSGYNDDTYWFELWNTVRKALFTALSLLFAPLGVSMQTWVALLLLLVFYVFFNYTMPYGNAILNSLERQALLVDVLTLLLGIGLFNNASNSEDRRSNIFAMVVSVSVVLVNIAYMVWLLCIFCKHSEYMGAAEGAVNKLRRSLSRSRRSTMTQQTGTKESEMVVWHENAIH